MLSLLIWMVFSSAYAEDQAAETLPLLEVDLEAVTIRKKLPIAIPEEAQALEVPRVLCPMRVYFGPKGRTEEVKVVECPEMFHENVRASVMGWRFKPMKTEEGQPARVTFVMTVNLPLNGR